MSNRTFERLERVRCRLCGWETVTRTTYERHMREQHERCGECGAWAVDEKALKGHRQRCYKRLAAAFR